MKDIDEAIQERQAMIARLQEEIAALKRVRPILTTDTTEGQLPLIPTSPPSRRAKSKPNSDASLAAKAMREAEKPLSITDIMAYLVRKGKRSRKGSVVSTLAKMAKRGQVFYRCVQPNTFGLLEWEERPDIREE